jgi:hypothetical protein
MVWYFLHLLATLLWDAMRLSRLSPDEKTLELLVLRQQLLILRAIKNVDRRLAPVRSSSC